MQLTKLRLVGVELYFDDLNGAKGFYRDTLGLEISDEEVGHHAQFDGDAAFLCLERKGAESYPSFDKAVVFLETFDLPGMVERIGRDRFVGLGPTWAVLHDPEGHNVLLVQASRLAD